MIAGTDAHAGYSLIMILALASGLAALTALITVWLPPTNRYAKWRKLSSG